ncbi:2-dehydropantoate 2-reductase [Glaciecola sp. XM2]|jgi:2-dehydropantoate 2-reductase|uniref:ketopantoate reductase family protein n=1 Tax=Glaciecola sp. XM2 TaxID=1914931 RepID=UPI001BDEE276|nr:2-dehydropantoate 2-reductase [Glaciecola sp. XM2]MBT1450901.1 2-dehydropantoate 2-reductase [Glaciecola sp. XM2]
MSTFGIIGNGAIGTGLAKLIADASTENAHDITQFVRRPCNLPVTIVESETDNAARKTTWMFKQAALDHQQSLDSLDLLILPLKYYQLREVLKSLDGRLCESLPILLLQNGLGGHQQLLEHFTHNPLFVGATTDAVQKVAERHFHIHARGDLVIGGISGQSILPAIQSLLDAHPNSRWDSNIMQYLYQKLAVNAVINPLTAIYRCANGDILDYPQEIAALKQEIRAVYQANEIEVDMHMVDRYIDHVIDLTKHNYSSMYQDVLHERPTEVDGILGTLQTKAAHKGICVPTITRLYEAIKAIEKDYS